MQIGVNEAVLERHLAGDFDAGAREDQRVVTDRANLVELDAVDELHREHAIAEELLDERGYDDPGIAVEVFAELPEVRGLDAEIELLVDGVAELPDGLERLDQREAR